MKRQINMQWKVGEIAKRLGLTVRALHHYEAVGLLTPTHRNEGGHRIYEERDLVQLQKILSLRQIGLSLNSIKKWIKDGGNRTSALEIVRLHIESLENERKRLVITQAKLKKLERLLSEGQSIPVDELIKTMEAITMYEKYLSAEQLKKISQRKEKLGESKIKEIQSEWPHLIAAVREKMIAGIDPKTKEVQALAKKWMDLSNQFSGGDIEISLALRNMYKNEPKLREKHFGMDERFNEYVGTMMFIFSRKKLR